MKHYGGASHVDGRRAYSPRRGRRVLSHGLVSTALFWALAIWTCTCFGRERSSGAPLTQACESLTSADFSGIEEAPSKVIYAQSITSTSKQPQYCEVRGYVLPRIGIELQLPLSGWNGKFLYIGCSGTCGFLPYMLNVNDWCPLNKGYACIFSDMGHLSGPGDGLWADNDWEAHVNFGYRATHVTAVAGKSIVERLYGQAPRYSYFMGASTGSVQGLIEAQRFPWDFSGIIVGALIVNNVFLSAEFIWSSRALKDDTGAPLLDRKDLDLLHQAALKQCDMDDGVRDGLISNPLACKFDPTTLLCGAIRQVSCLTSMQVEAVRKVYSGPTTSSGVKLGPGGALPGSEQRWVLESDANLGSGEYIRRDGKTSGEENWANEFFRWILIPAQGRGWAIGDFDFDKDYRLVSDKAQASLFYDNRNPDLRNFKAAGGKLLMYVGDYEWAHPRTAVDYYQTVERVMGGDAPTKEFCRLFLVPGMGHASGGDGPFAIDYLSYIEAWVERGNAPDALIGAHVPGTMEDAYSLKFPLTRDVKVSFTRPVYPYPLWAKYKGSGDVNRADSFEATGP